MPTKRKPVRKTSASARPRSVSADKRVASLLPGGKPKWIHCYDDVSDPVLDRYTCVFTGRYTHKTGGEHWYIGITTHGNYTSGESRKQIDSPTYSHLGKKVKFDTLPVPVQKTILQHYRYLWDLPGDKGGLDRFDKK